MDSVVAGPQLLLPAGRTASVASPGFVDQPAMTLPAPSVPSTSPPSDRSRLVLRVTGVLQLPPAGCTAASSMAVQVPHGQFPHTATVWPAGVTASTMRWPELGALPPWPRSVACQVFPFGLVQTWTCVVPSEAVKVPPAAMAPAWLTATELPHDPGSETGDDQVAASAGSAGEIPNPAAPASATRAPRPIHLRDRVRD